MSSSPTMACTLGNTYIHIVARATWPNIQSGQKRRRTSLEISTNAGHSPECSRAQHGHIVVEKIATQQEITEDEKQKEPESDDIVQR